MMEESVFPQPAVGGVLKEKFIEARLHNDGGPKKQQNVQRQKDLAGTVTTPVYVIVDPKTGEKLRLFEGPTTPLKFIEFLRGKALE